MKKHKIVLLVLSVLAGLFLVLWFVSRSLDGALLGISSDLVLLGLVVTSVLIVVEKLFNIIEKAFIFFGESSEGNVIGGNVSQYDQLYILMSEPNLAGDEFRSVVSGYLGFYHGKTGKRLILPDPSSSIKLTRFLEYLRGRGMLDDFNQYLIDESPFADRF